VGIRHGEAKGSDVADDDRTAEPVVLYEERESVALVTLNRPDKLNTLNEPMIEGIARAIDRAAGSSEVRAVVLRGAGRAFTAGYDLEFGERDPGFYSYNFGAPTVEHRAGAWDPVRDYQMMSHNARRFMRIWDCPKPVIGELHGWAIGGGTDLILCCDLIFMADDAYIGYPPSRIFGTPTTMMWVYRVGLEHAKEFLLSGDAIDAATAHRIGLVSRVYPATELAEATESFARRFQHIPANQLALNKMLVNQAFENMGLRTTQLLGTLFDGVARHTEEAQRWVDSILIDGLRDVVHKRDEPFGDYSAREKRQTEPGR
jgi:enoyl-CoA hydratase